MARKKNEDPNGPVVHLPIPPPPPIVPPPPSIGERLAAPFEPEEVEWKPQVVKGDRALAVAYIDARTVMDRLDEVIGIGNWRTEYRVVEDSIICKLSLRIAGAGWTDQEDIGSPSEQPDAGDRRKAAFSDALKRAGVHYGIGRYLYKLEPIWWNYDTSKRKFVTQPRLPDWALPIGRGSLAPIIAALTPPPIVPPKDDVPPSDDEWIPTVEELIEELDKVGRSWEDVVKWLKVKFPAKSFPVSFGPSYLSLEERQALMIACEKALADLERRK